mmetsp:Transcript_25528/g.70167  ORF Transcript_25528/g.70167 Transcript_25528/m.70167 type:complete len:521 (-) Transcript_25528:141-1703(-)
MPSSCRTRQELASAVRPLTSSSSPGRGFSKADRPSTCVMPSPTTIALAPSAPCGGLASATASGNLALLLLEAWPVGLASGIVNAAGASPSAGAAGVSSRRLEPSLAGLGFAFACLFVRAFASFLFSSSLPSASLSFCCSSPHFFSSLPPPSTGSLALEVPGSAAVPPCADVATGSFALCGSSFPCCGSCFCSSFSSFTSSSSSSSLSSSILSVEPLWAGGLAASELWSAFGGSATCFTCPASLASSCFCSSFSPIPSSSEEKESPVATASVSVNGAAGIAGCLSSMALNFAAVARCCSAALAVASLRATAASALGAAAGAITSGWPGGFSSCSSDSVVSSSKASGSGAFLGGGKSSDAESSSSCGEEPSSAAKASRAAARIAAGVRRLAPPILLSLCTADEEESESVPLLKLCKDALPRVTWSVVMTRAFGAGASAVAVLLCFFWVAGSFSSATPCSAAFCFHSLRGAAPCSSASAAPASSSSAAFPFCFCFDSTSFFVPFPSSSTSPALVFCFFLATAS